MESIDLTVIPVERAADLPSGKLCNEMPPSGVVYVYHAPHTIGGGHEWKVIVRTT